MQYETKLSIGDKFWWIYWKKTGPFPCPHCGKTEEFKETGGFSIIEDIVDELFISDGPHGFVIGYSGVQSKELEFPAFIIEENRAYKNFYSAKRGAKRALAKKIRDGYVLAC